jgi:hypothetical protein
MTTALISDPLGLFGIAILAFLILYVLIRLLTHKH